MPTGDGKKRVWLVRHGQALHNQQSGANKLEDARACYDATLTDQGKEQATSVPKDPIIADVLKPDSPDRIQLVVASPLLRTLQTAIGAFGDVKPALPFVAHPGFHEMNPVLCDTIRPIQEHAMKEFPMFEFSPEIAPLDKFHVKFYAPEDGGGEIELHPQNEKFRNGDKQERKRIDRACTHRFNEFTKWLAKRPETRIAVVGHHNCFRHCLGYCLENCQVLEFSLDRNLKWELVRGEPAMPPAHTCTFLKQMIGGKINPQVLALGSKNPGKITATERALEKYPNLGLKVLGVNVSSGISSQPKTLEETAQGAKNRAERAVGDSVDGCQLAMGLESGIFCFGDKEKLWYDITVCSVWDGKKHHLGFSPAWQLPPKIAEKIESGMDLTQACNAVQLVADPKVGDKEGAIGALSGRRVTRQDYTEQAILMALIACNPTWYEANDKGPGAEAYAESKAPEKKDSSGTSGGVGSLWMPVAIFAILFALYREYAKFA